MSNLKRVLRISSPSALVAIMSLTALPSLADTPHPHALFSEQAQASVSAAPKNAIAGNSRVVKFNRKNLDSGRFNVSLPGGVSYEAVRELYQDMGNGRFSWVGHASDDPENRVVIGGSGDAIAATFAYHGKLFKLEPRANGSHVLSEVRNTDPAPEGDPIPVADTSPVLLSAGANNNPAAAGNGQVIDVLVAYTPYIRSLYGTAGAEALIVQAVAEANQAYLYSKMSTRLNLVHTVMTNYVESGDIYTDLLRLRATSDGHMDELHALRNSHGADVVNLIAHEPLYCGLAYRMATLSPNFQSSAFSVVHHSCATGYYSFAHEIGHNQGAHHDAANASGAIFPYAYGYQDPYKRFRSIMAYDCPGGCPRGQAFSHGDNPFGDIPTGDPNYASNARAIDETAPIVAAFRQSATPEPMSPSNLHTIDVGTDLLSLSWTDESSDESGFQLERSVDGLNYTQIAALPENTTAYVDNNLQPATLYYYRVRAWNSSAFSDYSNVIAANTSAIPVYTEQFVDLELNAGGTISGSYEDIRNLDGISETITEIPSWGILQKPYGYLEFYWVIQVQPGASVTLHAHVSTSAPTQSFTFAYATEPTFLSQDRSVWTDMFVLTAQNSGEKQFTLPNGLQGPVYISVRDNERVPTRITSDSIAIDYLTIKTQLEENPPPPSSSSGDAGVDSAQDVQGSIRDLAKFCRPEFPCFPRLFDKRGK